MSYLHVVAWSCMHDIDIWIIWDFLWAEYDNAFNFFHFRNTSMMLQAAQDTLLGVWKQSKGRFVEDLHCYQIALLTFPQEAQISKGLLMLKGSLMGMLAKRPCPCSTIPQTIPWFSRRWERPFSTVRSLLMTQAEVLISSPPSQDSWIQKDW